MKRRSDKNTSDPLRNGSENGVVLHSSDVSQPHFLCITQGTGLPSEFPGVCQSVQLQEEQLHGPRQHLPRVVIHRDGERIDTGRPRPSRYLSPRTVEALLGI